MSASDHADLVYLLDKLASGTIYAGNLQAQRVIALVMKSQMTGVFEEPLRYWVDNLRYWDEQVASTMPTS